MDRITAVLCLVIVLGAIALTFWKQDGADAAADEAAKARLRAAVKARRQEIRDSSEGSPDGRDYIFTADWFSHNEVVWKRQLSLLSGQPIQALEIGSYEGRSAVWIIQNLLQHPNATITCIDGLDYRDGSGTYMVYERFKHNVLSKHPGKATLVRDWSDTALKQLALSGQQYDLIYIDGNHVAKAVLEDGVLSFPMLKRGGYLIFDDYEWKDLPLEALNHPRHGIDAFLDVYGPGIEVVEKGYQVIVRKI